MNLKIQLHTILLLISVVLFSACNNAKIPKEWSEADKHPQIFPDYTDLTIPSNIAPLNFMIKEPGEKFMVSISSKNGKEIKLSGSNPSIQIDIAKWKKLLTSNKGEELNIDIYSMSEGKWTKYKTIKHQVSKDNIDSYLTYRLISSAYVLWFEMGLYQRNLENFEESPIIQNMSIGGACVNCHSMSKNNPEKFMFHIRSKFSGTLIYNEVPPFPPQVTIGFS